MRISTSFFFQRGTNNLLQQQALLSDVQEQLSSGKRILRPSDDPSGSSHILRLQQAIDINEQFNRNNGIAENRLKLEESTLASVGDSLLRIRELTIQANTATLTNDDRKSIATEIDVRLDELYALANTKDVNQEYLFSGYAVNTKPFSRSADGSAQYNGDQNQRLLQIGASRQVADSNTGQEVFGDVLIGNGRFIVNDTASNTGSGIISVGQVFDSTTYVEDVYTISFVTNSSGNLAYNVVGANSGQLIPALPADATNDAPDFVSGADIQFNGVETSLTGVPEVGDSFTVSPSPRQDIFTTVSELVSILKFEANSDADQAKVFNQVTRSLANIDRSFSKITEMRASIGARLNAVEDQVEVNEAYIFELTTTLSQTKDVNVAEVAVQLQSQLTAYQAAQSSFIRIQSLNLFEFI